MKNLRYTDEVIQRYYIVCQLPDGRMVASDRNMNDVGANLREWVYARTFTVIDRQIMGWSAAMTKLIFVPKPHGRRLTGIQGITAFTK